MRSVSKKMLVCGLVLLIAAGQASAGRFRFFRRCAPACQPVCRPICRPACQTTHVCDHSASCGECSAAAGHVESSATEPNSQTHSGQTATPPKPSVETVPARPAVPDEHAATPAESPSDSSSAKPSPQPMVPLQPSRPVERPTPPEPTTPVTPEDDSLFDDPADSPVEESTTTQPVAPKPKTEVAAPVDDFMPADDAPATDDSIFDAAPTDEPLIDDMQAPADDIPDATLPATDLPEEDNDLQDLLNDSRSGLSSSGMDEIAETSGIDSADVIGDSGDSLDGLFDDSAEANATEVSDSPDESLSLFEVREWTDNTGEYKVLAKLVQINENGVRLLKETGKHTTVSFDRLSKSDRALVERFGHRLDRTASR